MQPQYPPQQYPPQFPVQPPQYPPQPYPPTQPAYPPQYAAAPVYAPPPPPAPPLPTGTLDTFYEQPSSGGGPSFKFMDANRQPLIGRSYAGIVARPVGNADVRAQTDHNGRLQTYKDGRPKFVMIVPMVVQPSQEFPEGVAGWWVKGQARDELARAMAEAGAPVGPPEAGAGIRVTLMSTRAVPNMSPAYVYRIEYMRPANAPTAPAQPTPMPQQPQYAQPQQPAPQPAPVYAPPVQQPQYAPPVQQPQYAPPVQAMPAMPQPPPVPPPAPVPQPAQPAAAPMQIPAGFNDEQAKLFAQLTGQPAPAATG